MRHNPWPSFLSSQLDDLKQEGLYRQLQQVESPTSTKVTINARSFLLFCSNDYLGLASDPRMKKAAAGAVRSWGTGSGASRLISGNISLYGDLEEDITRFKQTESALVFTCGYSANVGVISSLADQDDLVLSDALNHASIVDACRLSRAEVHVYPHGDVNYVQDFLARRPKKGKLLVVTDGVFSMDGDLAPLPDLYEVCREYGALLMVDDAHGTGVIGPKGGGTLDYFNMEEVDVVHAGTFSKALGSLGGFVAGSSVLMDYILNHARSLIFSTALPPSVLAANREGLRIVQEDSSGRKQLVRLINSLRTSLERLGIPSPPGPAPILPLVIGKEKETVSLSHYLWEKGMFVPPIRPPTVPRGTSRLRISLSALHSKKDLDRLVEALEDYFRLGS
jgi:8-amino-7-oxononanoate synthase